MAHDWTFAINPLVAVGVLASTAATDAAYVFFSSAVATKHRVRAANWAVFGICSPHSP